MDPNETQDPTAMQANPAPVSDGTPYFMSGHALIKFSGGEDGVAPETYWLVDQSNHTIRPFESHMALDAAFGQDLETALQNAVTVTPPNLDQQGDVTDGVLAGFTILGPEYAVKEDGTSKPLHFSSHQLKGRYGKPIDEGIEHLATEAVDGFLGLLKTNEDKTNIPGTFIAKLKGDHQLMAFYISAMAYGGYNLGDIYSDIRKRFHNQD